MKVQELTRDQLIELKQNYYCNVLHEDEGVSWGELAEIDELVDDDEVFSFYKEVDFVKE